MLSKSLKDSTITWFEPSFVNERLFAQQGVFLVPNTLEYSHEEILNETDFKDFLIKIKIHIHDDIIVFLPHLPQLAGFTVDPSEQETFLRAYRRVRNDLFRERFYGTMRDMAHARNVDWYSESGGPWQRNPEVFREADQIAYLAVNDLPQGEFWPAASSALPGYSVMLRP